MNIAREIERIKHHDQILHATSNRLSLIAPDLRDALGSGAIVRLDPSAPRLAPVGANREDRVDDRQLFVVAARVKKLKHEDIEISGLYWHFVDLVWMFVFPLIYIMSVDMHGALNH